MTARRPSVRILLAMLALLQAALPPVVAAVEGQTVNGRPSVQHAEDPSRANCTAEHLHDCALCRSAHAPFGDEARVPAVPTVGARHAIAPVVVSGPTSWCTATANRPRAPPKS
ncbi:MAG: hypothetical protein FJ202_11095 [Gemmatimonadetes bacterium]|nr:hypothetical protein [Gemmatimonadota bacterium]